MEYYKAIINAMIFAILCQEQIFLIVSIKVPTLDLVVLNDYDIKIDGDDTKTLEKTIDSPEEDIG